MSDFFKISGYAVCAFICLFAAISCGQDEELPAVEVELAQTEIEVSLSGGGTFWQCADGISGWTGLVV